MIWRMKDMLTNYLLTDYTGTEFLLLFHQMDDTLKAVVYLCGEQVESCKN